MRTSDIVVIGGGPAGMMAAVHAALSGAEVTLLEKNEKTGKKLYITGKGRCNLTNRCDIADFFGNVVTNSKFLYSALYSFTNEDTWEFFEDHGLKLKEERGMRVFPASDKSSDVIRTLDRALKDSGADVRLFTEVEKIEKLTDGNGMRFRIGLKDRQGKNSYIKCRSVIIATGGLSYKSTGSTGDGYVFARQLGHRVTETYPSLCPLAAAQEWVQELEGLSLKNVRVRITAAQNILQDQTDKGKNRKGKNGQKELFNDLGEMLFTKRGVSGPLILSASAKVTALLKNMPAEEEGLTLGIDLKPALDAKQLDERILKDFDREKNRNFCNSLNRLLPSKLIPVIVRLSGIDPNKKVNEVTKDERAALVNLLKDLRLNIIRTEGFEQAVITQGGVDVRQIDPSTMESKVTCGLYFAGEVIDVDAFTGGFNIQIAMSTGVLAGRSAAESLAEQTYFNDTDH